MQTFADFYEGDPLTTAREYRAGHRELVALKVSEGNRVDSTFHQRWHEFGQTFHYGRFTRRRIRRMPYTYCHPHLHPAGATVLFALAQVHRAGGFRAGFDLPLALDVEVTEGLTGAQLLRWIEDAAGVAHHYTRRGVVLYIPGWMAEQLPRHPAGATVVWVPGYPFLPAIPSWARLFAHQFTDRGWPVPGSTQPCDLSNLHMNPRELVVR